jgi:putative glutamine amidotransferase
MARVALLVGREPAHRYSVHRGYADALWAIGAVPVLLPPPPSDRADDLEMFVESALACDAVCVTGGGDVDPVHYGEDPAPGLMSVDTLRDEAEIAVVRRCVADRVSVLGICRGIQLVAVACGGALHQDLGRAGYEHHWEEERQYEPVHPVEADAGSLASRSLGGVRAVNSIHHQAVRHPGPVLRSTAWSGDGVIEAVEADGVLGVQWHPERLWSHDDRHLAPFRWLVAG